VTVHRAILSFFIAVVVTAESLGLAGTADAQSAAARRVTTPPAPPQAEGVEIPRSYERKGRRDPFQPIEAAQAGEPAVAAARLKGILRGGAPRVLVETPDGIGYILRLGDALGEGRLIEIGAESVVFSVPSRRGSPSDRIVLRLSSD
jgi:hypothetical protein